MTFDTARWLKRIKEDEAFQSERHATWKTNLSLYNMKYWRALGYNALTTDKIIPVNYITTFVSTLVSSVYSRNPKIFVRSRYDRFNNFADVMEALLERFWDEQDLKATFIEVIRDVTIFGIGWLEMGFLPERFESPPTPEVREPVSRLNRLQDLIQMVTGQDRENTEEPEPISTKGILNVHQQPGSFFCVRRSPYDVLWPSGYHSFSSLPYLTIRDRIRKEDFLADPRYTNKQAAETTSLKQETGSKFQKADFSNIKSERSSNTSPTDKEVIDLFHIWDRREMAMTTVSRKTLEPHAGPHDWPYFSEGFPVSPLTFNGVPDLPDDANAYPFSDIEPITAQVLEKSAIRTAMQQHRKRSNAVVFVQKGGTTEAEVSNYARASEAISVIPLSNIQAVQMGPTISIPPAIFQTEEAINTDLDRDSGLQLILADLARSGQIDRATVATIAQGNAALKTNYKVDRVEMYAKGVARYLSGLFWQYMTKAQVAQMTGVQPDEQTWPDLPTNPQQARTRIHQVLEFRIEAGSTRPIQDDVLDREQFLRFIRIFQATAPQKFVQVENQLLALMAKKFREPGLEAIIKTAISQSDQQVAQQENQLLSQGMVQLVRETDDHQAHLSVHAQAAQSPIHKLQAEQAAASGQAHPLDSHILQHAQFLQAKVPTSQRGERRNRQGISQQSVAPSATELTRSGIPTASDLQSRGMNLGVGSGAEAAGTIL